MPVQYDLPEYTNAGSIEDVNKYNKLPFYLAMLEAQRFSTWQTWNQLYGKISWKPNMGSTMRGIRAEPTPVGQMQFFPNDVTSLPNKNVYETFETSEDATLKWHDFDSKQFNFLPIFQDFRENQLDFVHQDIVQQIATSNDFFIRTVIFQKAPYIFVPGNKIGGTQLLAAPAIPSGTTMSQANVDSMGKSTNYLKAIVNANVGTNLTLAALDNATTIMRDDIGAPFFEGTVNTPKDNDLIKGRYVVIGSSEAYQQFKWDPNFSQFRNINLSVVNDGFRGAIFDEITWKTERYPIRIAADGTMPAPETYDNDTKRTQPSLDYVNAPFEVAFMCGGDAYKTIKVGPPPRAFTGKKMSAAKFFSMNWNAEVQLTDQVLVKYSDGTIDTNVRGRFLKFISTAIMGAIPVNARWVVPIIFARKRAAVV